MKNLVMKLLVIGGMVSPFAAFAADNNYTNSISFDVVDQAAAAGVNQGSTMGLKIFAAVTLLVLVTMLIRKWRGR